MWLGMKVIPDHKQYMFIPQVLGKEGFHHQESFSLTSPNIKEKEQPDHVWEAFEDSFQQTSSFRS